MLERMVLSTNKYKGLPCLDIITLKLSKDLKYLDVTNFRFKASSRQINSESRPFLPARKKNYLE